MNEQTTKAMLAAAETVVAQAKKAEKEYDKGAAEIKRMTASAIQLGRGTAVDKAARITAKAREISDTLYASLQALVSILDTECRPLLALDPNLLAIRRIAETIKWLNDESKIEASFTASVNQKSRGTVAAVTYTPSLENQVIEKFWETAYDTHPLKAAFEKEEQENERRLKKEREEKAKKEAEEKEAFYQKALTEWQVKANEVRKKRAAEINASLAKLKKERLDDIEARYKESLKNAKNATTFLENKKLGHERALESASLLAFKRKKEAKEGIQIAIDSLNAVARDLEKAEALHKKELSELDAYLDVKRQSLEAAAREKHPMPKKPRKETVCTDPREIVTESILADIYETMQPGRDYTVNELIDEVATLADATAQRALGYLRRILGEDLERVERDRQVYFRLIET